MRGSSPGGATVGSLRISSAHRCITNSRSRMQDRDHAVVCVLSRNVIPARWGGIFEGALWVLYTFRLFDLVVRFFVPPRTNVALWRAGTGKDGAFPPPQGWSLTAPSTVARLYPMPQLASLMRLTGASKG
jgi:hypothetical protein